MYERAAQLPVDEFIFPFTNNRHHQWAVLVWHWILGGASAYLQLLAGDVD